MPSLEIQNFAKGWLSDAELDPNKIYSLKTFVNSDISYERGASVRRPGYNRHHALLPAPPKQFYEFVDLSAYQNELTISDGKLYWYSETADAQYEVKNASEATPASLTFVIRDNYPFVTIGNRVCFADDTDWYWTDNLSLQHVNGSPTPHCYQVGIAPIDWDPDGNMSEIDPSPHELAGALVLGWYRYKLSCARLTNYIIESKPHPWPLDHESADIEITASPRTTQLSNLPASDDGQVTHITIYRVGPAASQANLDNYTEADYQRVGVINNAAGIYRDSEISLVYYSGITGTTFTPTSVTVTINTDLSNVMVGMPVDAGSVTKSYAVVTSIDDSNNIIYVTRWTPSTPTNNTDVYVRTGLPRLQSMNHNRLSDVHQPLVLAGRNVAPYFLDIWNGRFWAVLANSNILYFSKLLEQAGALGVAGDSIYDYFPADNKWTLDSQIRSIRKRGEDEFVVYTSNNNVHVYRGGDSPLNPPPDLSHQEIEIGSNCIDDRTLQEIRGRHIFVTSDKEIKAFSGTVDLEELGEGISSEIALTGDKYSACIYKNQYCLGCDTDGDDVMDSVFILDLSRPAITNWRRYQYLNSNSELMKFYNLLVTRDARMFVCPEDLEASAYYVTRLMTGFTDDWTTKYDDGVDITRVLQTQFIIPARRARWSRLVLTAFYPHSMSYSTEYYQAGGYSGDETIPTYTIYAIGKSDEFLQTSIAPSSSRDVRGHTVGIRLLSEECSIRIEDTGNKPDEIRSLTLYWSFN